MLVLKSIAEENQLQLLNYWPWKVPSHSKEANSCSFYATTYRKWLQSHPSVHRLLSNFDGLQLLKQHVLYVNFRSTQIKTRALMISLKTKSNRHYSQLTKNLTPMQRLLPSLWGRLELSATGNLDKLYAMIVGSFTQFLTLVSVSDCSSISILTTAIDKKFSYLQIPVTQRNLLLSDSSQYQT